MFERPGAGLSRNPKLKVAVSPIAPSPRCRCRSTLPRESDSCSGDVQPLATEPGHGVGNEPVANR
jgi:hypothetical protein